MARRCDKVDAEALNVVDRIVKGDDLQLAAVAGPGIHLADCQRASKDAVDILSKLPAQLAGRPRAVSSVNRR